MKDLPTQNRPSTRLLKDLYKLRKKLVAIENSSEPFVSKIRPLQRKDYWLSHALIKILSYENDFDIKFKEPKEIDEEDEKELF